VICETMYNHRLAVAFNVSLHAKTELSVSNRDDPPDERVKSLGLPFDKCLLMTQGEFPEYSV